MSCPDWRTLSAAREAETLATTAIAATAPDADPPGWAEAREHAAQCSRCRAEALAADPLLLFARLPERVVTPAEIGDMQSAVAALVRSVEATREWVETVGRFANPKRKQTLLDRCAEALARLKDGG